MLLTDRIGTIEGLHGTAIDFVSNPAARLLQTVLSELSAEGADLEPHQIHDLSRATIELTRACFRPAENAPRDSDRLQKIAIRRLIEQTLASRDLDLTGIGSRFGLSAAKLHRLFAEEGGLGAYIRERRLQRAMRLLTQGARPRVSSVAYATGFSDLSAFSRAFKRRFGVAPMEAGFADAAAQTGSSAGQALLSWMRDLGT